MPKKCPLLGKECIQDRCEWWATYIVRPDPGKPPIAENACVIPRITHILIELLGKTDGVAASIESERNEFMKAADRSNVILAGMGQIALENRDRKELESG
jgi:hypothetical protein